MHTAKNFIRGIIYRTGAKNFLISTPRQGVLVVLLLVFLYFLIGIFVPGSIPSEYSKFLYVRNTKTSPKTLKKFYTSTHSPKNANVGILPYQKSTSATKFTKFAVNDRNMSIGNNCEFNNLTFERVFSGNLNLTLDDMSLVGYVRKCHLIPPSTLSYNLTDPNGDPSKEQGVRKFVLEKLLGNKTNGTFIECGANDGEDISNTLVLERDYGWSGLLIEADPKNSEMLVLKHRNAWVAQVCAGIHAYPYKMKMYRHKKWKLTSRLVVGGYERVGLNADWTAVNVNCLPLYTMMLAANLTEIDYFSLDVEGVELSVLRTLPFERIRIKVFSIETTQKNWDQVRSFMRSKGYHFIKTFRQKYIEDDVFAHFSVAQTHTTTAGSRSFH